jgi:hypothetical protein
MARLQKCGGVHRKSTTANASGNGPSASGATAAAPASTAKLPASPPITMFHHVRRFSHTV